MNGYSSKLSLYDFIVMLMPGSIIVGVMIVLGTDGNLSLRDNSMFWLFFFVASYLAGIINHIATGAVFRKFRNCPKMILRSFKKAMDNGYKTLHNDLLNQSQNYDTEERSKDDKKWCKIVLLVTSVVFILLILCSACKNCIIDKKVSPTSCCVLIIFCVVLFIILLVSLRNVYNQPVDKDFYKETDLLNCYYQEYYYVRKECYGNDIEILESQVAFLQSLIIPMVLILVTYLMTDKNLLDLFFIKDHYSILPCCFTILYSILFGAISVSIFLRQQKIYDRVWEDYHYLKKYYKELKDEERSCQ